jgi:hypothetical protein
VEPDPRIDSNPAAKAAADKADSSPELPRKIYPCFLARFGGVSGGKETQGWRVSSHTAMVGAGKFGSAKLPMATGDVSGKTFILPENG